MYYVITAHYTSHTDTSQLNWQERYQPAWWRLDLGVSYDVYQVIIFNTDVQQGISVPRYNSQWRKSYLENVLLYKIKYYYTSTILKIV